MKHQNRIKTEKVVKLFFFIFYSLLFSIDAQLFFSFFHSLYFVPVAKQHYFVLTGFQMRIYFFQIKKSIVRQLEYYVIVLGNLRRIYL
jgi:hypothetical protein